MESKNIKELEEELKRLKLENQILEESNRFKENAQPHVKKSGWLNEFFWWCAGVDKEIIRQCPTDHAKYVGIGGTILFTALMAMLSAGYALSTVFDNLYAAIGFGIFWGLLIFNLDRFIVNTMYSDGEAKISWQEFKSGLPRIIMAIFLGVVISTPLELKIFEDEISIVIREQIQDRIREYQKEDKTEISKLQNERDSLSQYLSAFSGKPIIIDVVYGTNEEVNNLITTLNALREDGKLYDREKQEIDGKLKEKQSSKSLFQEKAIEADSITRIELDKQISELDKQIEILKKEKRDKENDIENNKKEIIKTQSQIVALSKEAKDALQKEQDRKDQEIARIQNEINSKDSSITVINLKIENDGYAHLIQQEYGGFQAQMNAFSEMKKENKSTNISSLFIMLLFIIIETAPTFFKMMMEDGPYDHLKQAKMAAAKALAVKLESQANDDVNTELSISQAKNEKRLEAELKANEAVLDKIASVQSELIKTSLELWRKEELKKIEENPTVYLTKNDDEV